MASLVTKALVKKTFRDTAKQNINSQNPYEEEVPVYGRDGRPTGKVKKRKRPIPTGFSAHDTSILKKVRRRAYRLDMSLFNCCGIRFGWSSVIAIIPFIGDFIDAFMALMLVKTCDKVDGGLPTSLKMRMHFNILLDFALGLVPFVGDIADAIYRANTRNAWLLEVYLTKKAEAERKGHVSDPELGTELPTRPQPARVQSKPEVRVLPGSRNGGSYANGKVRRPDEEMAMPALQYSVDAVGYHANGRPGAPGRYGSDKSWSSRDGLPMTAPQYGGRGALDAYSNGRSRSAGRR